MFTSYQQAPSTDMKAIKSFCFGVVRLVRCIWTLGYCALIILAVVQLRAVILDPVALPHMFEMTANFITTLNPFA